MRKRECFVIMPFSDKENPDNKWDDLFENNLKPAVDGANLGYTCIRADPYGNFMRHIMNHLADADVVIAVLTELRPNVMYELGVRNALRRRTIMIAEEQTIIPSDLSAFIAFYYSIKTKPGRDKLAQVIQRRLAMFDLEELDSDNPAADYLEKRAQKICDQWRANKDPKILTSKITDVLPSYAFQLGLLLNEIGQHLRYSRIEKSVRASLSSSDVMTEVKAAGKERAPRQKDISKMLASVADKTIEAIREENFLTIDTRPLLARKSARGEILQLPYDQFPSASSFIDYVYTTMRRHIESMTYGVKWVLQDSDSGKMFKDAGRTWAKEKLGKDSDDRTLASVGIKRGMKLNAVPFSGKS